MFTMCYGWWLADSVQFLLLGIRFLLILLSAYFLRKQRDQRDAPHSFQLILHLFIGLGASLYTQYS
jgi:hypothetical protein